MSDEHESAVIITTVTITHTYYPDRELEEAQTIRVDTEGEPTLVELLGLLEFAKIDLMAPAIRSVEDDDE